MAGDWIKYRTELQTHPRFLSLCNETIYDPERIGMLIYACGSDALEIGVLPPSNKSVTERALRCVTEAALRDVTMSALLRVWSSVNAHCDVEGEDAVMTPMRIYDIDIVAGFDGFGDAMQEVGWAEEVEPNSVRFPRFLKFNEPSCLRHQPKTGAERQKAHRAKKAKSKPPKVTVTESNESNDREEKRREELNTLSEPVTEDSTEAASNASSDNGGADQAGAFDQETLMRWEALLEAYPTNGDGRISGQHLAQGAFALLATPEQEHAVQAARHYAESGDVLAGKIFRLDRWLDQNLWRDWIEAKPKPQKRARL